MTEEMTEDHAGIFIMNNKYYVNDIAFRRNILNYVKVINLSDILSHSYTHLYSQRFTHKRIQSRGFGLPELGVDSTLP